MSGSERCPRLHCEKRWSEAARTPGMLNYQAPEQSAVDASMQRSGITPRPRELHVGKGNVTYREIRAGFALGSAVMLAGVQKKTAFISSGRQGEPRSRRARLGSCHSLTRSSGWTCQQVSASCRCSWAYCIPAMADCSPLQTHITVAQLLLLLGAGCNITCVGAISSRLTSLFTDHPESQPSWLSISHPSSELKRTA